MTKLLKDRVKLIRALQKSIPLATANGDQSALKTIIETVRGGLDDFLSYSQEDSGKISYAAKPEFRFCTARRTKTTLGRYIRRRLLITDDQLSSDGLNQITNTVFGWLMGEGTAEITLLTGARIVEAYRNKIGEGSCMTGDYCQYTQLYADNPDKVALVLFPCDGLEHKYGRALLWTTDEGKRVLDRIYPNSGIHVAAMRTWAASQGYLNRTHESMPDDTGVEQLGADPNDVYHVTLNHKGDFPYLDTFHWGDKCDRHVILSNSSEDCDARFDSCAGSYTSFSEGYDSDYKECHYCGDRFDHSSVGFCVEDEFYYCSRRCRNEESVECEDCETLVHNDNSVSIGDHNYCSNDCRDNASFLCSACGRQTHNDYKVAPPDNGDPVCPDCWGDMSFVCSGCGDRRHNDCKAETVDGAPLLCRNCVV